jgi:hypothetical protein
MIYFVRRVLHWPGLGIFGCQYIQTGLEDSWMLACSLWGCVCAREKQNMAGETSTLAVIGTVTLTATTRHDDRRKGHPYGICVWNTSTQPSHSASAQDAGETLTAFCWSETRAKDCRCLPMLSTITDRSETT